MISDIYPQLQIIEIFPLLPIVYSLENFRILELLTFIRAVKTLEPVKKG